jgi:hypothetical protein
MAIRWPSIPSPDESVWLERWGLPHTDRLHTIERVARVDLNTLKYKLTIDE